MVTRVFSLNVHATWKCRHSGACCRAGWSIPVEPHARPLVGTDWLEPDSNGACPQFDSQTSLCRIHRDHGEAMLPSSCHHFPRRALIDARGTFVSLSHFCPTAAAMLVDADRLDIVEGPRAFPEERGYEGLDARGEWPPLLRPTALLDEPSFSAWERFLVSTLGSSPHDVEATLARVADAAERLRRWSADQGELETWTACTLLERGGNDRPQGYERFSGDEVFARVCELIPEGLNRPEQPAPVADHERNFFEREWRQQAPTVLRYLGARAFASWTAYQSSGIRTQVAELYVTASVLRAECLRQWHRNGQTLPRAALVEAVRGADWLLVHLIDRTRLMAWLGQVEECTGRASRPAPASPR
jgi:hypothetical protein